MRNFVFKLGFICVSLTVFSCKEKIAQKNVDKIQLHLIGNGTDTLRLMPDSTYNARVLPYILNLTDDTVCLISAIYGRANMKNRNIYPKYGYSIFQNGEKIAFNQNASCGNYGNLDPKYFVLVPPGRLMLPFKKQVNESENFDELFRFTCSTKGEIEIEAYYDVSDTTQQFYHPFSDEEIKMNLGVQEYQLCRPYFLKIPHISLKSEKVKFYLK